jgi:hypothetical protein
VNIRPPKAITNQDKSETLEFEIDPTIGRLLFQNKIYTDKAIGAQEIPSNGRDAIRRLQNLPTLIQEDLEILRGLNAGKPIEALLKKHAKFGTKTEKQGVPTIDEDLLSEYAPIVALGPEEREAQIAQLTALQARVRAVLDSPNYEASIVFDVSRPDVVRFTDNGCGMSRQVVEDIYRHYGRSDKRGRKGSVETGGFGIGAKSPFAVADSFFLTTRSIEDDVTYHVVVTKEGVDVSVAKESLPHYGTVVEIPLAQGEKRAAYEAKFREKVAYWQEPAYVQIGLTSRELVSQEAEPWKSDEAWLKIAGKGWEAAVLPPSGTSQDVLVVDRIPFKLDTQSIPGFTLVVNVLDPNLVRLPATRESVEKDDHRTSLLTDIVTALRKGAKKASREVQAELEATPLTADLEELAEAFRGRLVALAYIAEGGRTADAAARGINTETPADDTYIELDAEPKDILAHRAGRLLERDFADEENASPEAFGAFLRQERTLTAEQYYAIKLLHDLRKYPSITPNGKADHGRWSSWVTTMKVGADANGTQTYRVPTFGAFWGADLEGWSPTREGDTITWARQTGPLMRCLLTPGHTERVRFLVSKTSLPVNRNAAVAQLLGCDYIESATEIPPEVHEYVGNAPLDSMVVLRGRNGFHDWLLQWGVCDFRSLPLDVSHAGPRASRASAPPRIRILNCRRTSTHLTLEEIRGRLGEEDVLVHLRGDEEAHTVYPWIDSAQCAQDVPGSRPGAWMDRRVAMFMRPTGKKRLQELADADIAPVSLKQFQDQVMAAGVQTLKKSRGELVLGPVLTLAQCSRGVRNLFSCVLNDAEDRDDLETARTDLMRDTWVQRLPDGALIIPDHVASSIATWLIRLDRQGAFKPEQPQDFVLAHIDDQPARIKVRMTLEQAASALSELALETPATDIPIELWIAASQRSITEKLRGAVNIIRAEPATTSKDASKAGEANAV